MPTVIKPSVTLREIVRIRLFTHFAAPYLRIIILPEIVRYAAITITPPTAGRPSIADVSSLKCLGFRKPRGEIHQRSERAFQLVRFDACDAFRLSNKVQQTRRDYQIRYTLSN